MTMDYSELRGEVAKSISASGDYGDLLPSLKNLYREDINSSRRFETVKSIRDLITVLEIRNTLSEDNVEPLKEIARRIYNGDDLIRKLSDYEQQMPRKLKTNTNLYVSNGPSNTMQSISNMQIPSHSVNPASLSAATIYFNPYGGHISPRKKQLIEQTIIERIGSQWCEFARQLDIQQGTIDGFLRETTIVPLNVKKVIEFYNIRANPQTWFLNISDALESARRNDLNKMLKEIITMNI